MSAITPLRNADLADVVGDPVRFLPRLEFVDEQGTLRRLDTPFPEQVDLLRARIGYRKNHVVKPRQIGCGTVVQAYDFWYGYVALDPVATLVVAHEQDATDRHHRRYVHFHGSLPRPLQHPVIRSNRKELEFADTGAMFRCMTAGGRSEGKAHTYQRLHLTEMAFWGDGAAELYGSLLATVHDGPHTSITVESTSNGFGDFFHYRTREAMRDPEWHFQFFKWSDHPSYRAAPPPGFEPTHEEWKIAKAHHLDDAQLYWRRCKLSEVGGLDAFRKDYPLTVEEAFLKGGESYFPDGWLMEVAEPLPLWDKAPMRVFERASDLHRYVVGVDVGGGMKKDYSVVQVLDERLEQVACWSDHTSPPHLVAEKACEIANAYGKALLLIEANNHGHSALLRARQLGYDPLYRQGGKDFVTSHKSKPMLFDHARKLMFDRAITLRDRVTVDELLNIREDDRGAIGAGEGHDDHAMALVLALWAAKRLDYASARSPFDVLKSRFGIGGNRPRATLPWGPG